MATNLQADSILKTLIPKYTTKYEPKVFTIEAYIAFYIFFAGLFWEKIFIVIFAYFLHKKSNLKKIIPKNIFFLFDF